MAGLPSVAENPQGLHQRYLVSKMNGEPVDHDAVYLVLRLDSGGKDKEHINACRTAAMQYADYAPKHLQQMATELRRLVLHYDKQDRERLRTP